jgi:two-component system, OmpR family, phosphate regulon sensor histidine kinase PhoR
LKLINMFLNSRVVSFLLALIITFLISSLLFILSQNSLLFIGIIALITFVFTYLLIFTTLQFFIFKEIRKIYEHFEHIRQGDFNRINEGIPDNKNLLKRLSLEIFSYANIKQHEINELKKMEAYRKEFLADVSHELKTPLFAAQGFVHTLLDGAINDRTVRIKFLKKAAKSLAGLDKLVEDLLTISQLEAGNIKMHFSNFNLYYLIDDVFEQFEGKAEKKNLELCFTESSPHDIMVYADRERIHQVMTNLISNSIKYTVENGGKVMVNIIPGKQDVMIEVSDNGIGIPQEDINRIFERFYRVDKSRSKDKGGTGLGLAIVKHILDAHNQKIVATSAVGTGSTFRFSLPVYSEQRRTL